MFLLLALVLLTVSSAQIDSSPLADGVEGVCHKIQNAPYTYYEQREVTEYRTQWCWNIRKGFRCEVPYMKTESVPVTKQREVETLVCCEGWELYFGACVKLPTLPSIPSDTPAVASEDPFVEPAETSDEDLSPEVLEMAPTPAEASLPSTPQSLAPIVVEHVDDEQDKKAEVNPIIKFLMGQKAPAQATSDESAPRANANPEIMAAEAIGIVAKELIGSLDNPSHSEPTVNADTAEAAVPAESLKNADPEVMAAEAIGIVAKEIIKSLGNETNHPAEAATSEIIPEPAAASDDIKSPAPTDIDTEALNPQLMEVEKTLLLTMKDLSETFLRSMSRLHKTWSSLRRYSAPQRASFD